MRAVLTGQALWSWPGLPSRSPLTQLGYLLHQVQAPCRTVPPTNAYRGVVSHAPRVKASRPHFCWKDVLSNTVVPVKGLGNMEQLEKAPVERLHASYTRPGTRAKVLQPAVRLRRHMSDGKYRLSMILIVVYIDVPVRRERTHPICVRSDVAVHWTNPDCC
jgi:hypothetical protein